MQENTEYRYVLRAIKKCKKISHHIPLILKFITRLRYIQLIYMINSRDWLNESLVVAEDTSISELTTNRLQLRSSFILNQIEIS